MPLEDAKPIPIPIPVSYTIRITCPNCGGVGSRTVNPPRWFDDEGNPIAPTTKPCVNCEATGKVVWGEMVAE
jgi:hypothetical protein